jgi:hypothetical protein
VEVTKGYADGRTCKTEINVFGGMVGAVGELAKDGKVPMVETEVEPEAFR